MTHFEQGLVNSITARNVAVAARIDAVYMSSAPEPRERVLDFEDVLESGSSVVGRDGILAAVGAFAAAHDRGYFDIVGEAGLGKTALAAAIARQQQAVCFFASANRGLRRPDQFLTHASAALIVRYGLPVDRLPEMVGADATFFTRMLRSASQTLAPGAAVWLVVDALDEADPPANESNPLLLPDDLPSAVYVVVTRRHGPELSTVPSTPVERYILRRDDPLQAAAIDAYLRSRAESARIAPILAAARPPISVEAFVTRLRAASDGNFMYLSYVIEDLAQRRPDASVFDLDTLPKGLAGYYERFWARLQEARGEGWADWNSLYRPVLERLGVAFEPVTASWLGAQVGRPTDEIRERVLDRWQRLLGRESRGGLDAWRVVHRSFADFLATRVDLGAAHAAVADHYAVGLRQAWAAWDAYGLRHAVSHYAAASRTVPPPAPGLTERLVALVTDSDFQNTTLEQLVDPTQIERDLELAVRTAAADQREVTVPLLVEVVLSLMTFRRQQRRTQPIFDLARRGQLVAAERRLDLFALEIDEDWHAALLVTTAWLGAAADPPGARQLLDRIQAADAGSPTLDRLCALVRASLDRAPPPVLSLEAPASPATAAAIVDRLSGSSYDRSLLGELSPELHYGPVSNPDGVFYLAHNDGQPLVAFAAVEPSVGEPLLRRYIQIHAAYGYRQYRDGSLWALLDAVLRHPRADWVQAWLPELGDAVLAPIRGEFLEALEQATLGCRARLSDSTAAAELESCIRAARQDAADLRTGNAREQGDIWGTHKRRLAALAEVLVRATGREKEAAELIVQALDIHYGFAGFTAPAALRLAEAASIVRPSDAEPIERALAAAQNSAHNVNDPVFCLRTTARVKALHDNWWRVPFAARDPRGAAVRLASDASTSEFAARHEVGEPYAQRDRARTVQLPDELREAQTLAQLARAFERPLADFQRLNPGPDVDAVLPIGTAVHVPDPGIAPLIATCLAAQAMSAAALTPADQAAAVRRLVPVASRDATALDTLLARLLLLTPGADAALLARLQQLAAINRADAQGPDDRPAGELTALPA